MSSEDTTLRPLGKGENAMNVFHKHGNTTNVFTVWIDTKTVVPDDAWEKSLSLLQKNYPTLRLRIVEKGGKKHFKYMDEPRIQFEALHLDKADDWKEHHESMMRVRFDTENGPMWHVKLLRMPQVNSNGDDVEGEGEFGYRNILMFVFNHCITDGKSNIIMLSRFVNVLNAVIAGETVECGDVTTLKPSIEHLIPQEQFKLRLKDFPVLIKEIYNGMFSRKNSFLEKFPPPQLPADETGCTRVVPLEFTESETESLLKKCKIHGITVQGILMAAANIAMAQMINEGASTPRPLTFNSMHAVTFRRYIPQDLSNTLGCFIGTHEINIPVPADTSDQFWPQAKLSTTRFHEALNGDDILQKYRVLLSLIISDKLLVEKFLFEKKCEKVYETSNIGDYDIVYPTSEDDRFVKAHKVVSSTAMHNLHTPCIHYLRKFRGRFLYNLDYATNWTSDQNAHKYAHLTVGLMKEASRRDFSTSACTNMEPRSELAASALRRKMPSSPTTTVRAFLRLSRVLVF